MTKLVASILFCLNLKPPILPFFLGGGEGRGCWLGQAKNNNERKSKEVIETEF